MTELNESKRIIKFRCWDKGNRKMIYLDDLTVFQSNEGDYKYGNQCQIGNIYGKNGLGFHDDFMEGGKGVDELDIELMQFTGFRDKKEKQIYEGDRVTDGVQEFEITFKFGTFLVGSTPIWNFTKDTELEIVGNIHEIETSSA